MPTVELPDSREIEFPDGTSNEVMNEAIRNFLTEQPSISSPKSSDTSFLGNTAQNAGRFAMGIPSGLGNVAIGGTQAVTDIFDPNGQSQFSQNLARGVKERNTAQSQLPLAERAGISTGEVAPFLGVGSGMGLVRGGALSGLAAGELSAQEEPGLENRQRKMLEGAAIGVGTGTALKGLGAISGSMGSTLSNAWKGVFAEPVEKLELAGNQIKQRSTTLYEKMREMGVILKPEATAKIVEGIQNNITKSGRLHRRLHGDTMAIVSDLKKAASKGNLGLEELGQYRQLFGEVASKNTDAIKGANSDAFKATRAIKKLDEIIESLADDAIQSAAGTNIGRESIDLFKSAIKEWKRYRKFDTITNIVRKADGNPDRLKSGLQSFVGKSKNLRGFTGSEVQALKEASKNTTSEKLLKTVGKFGFDLGGPRTAGNALLPAAFSIAGAAGIPHALPLVAVGTVAKHAQRLAALGKVDKVLDLIQERGPSDAMKIIKALPKKSQEKVLSALLGRGVGIGLVQSNNN